MASVSAGILMYKRRGPELLVLLVHPGGPFWRRRDLGAWSIPKGELASGEAAEAAARREFAEELGVAVTGRLTPLGRIRQRGGKTVEAFGVEGELDLAGYRCASLFEIEWPPRSGRIEAFPEIDRAAWLPLPQARARILSSQLPLLDRLEELCAARP